MHGGDIYSHDNKNIIDFSANINPLGMPYLVKKSIIENIELYENYPDSLCRELKLELAKNLNIKNDWLVCGNGAADLIFRLVISRKPKRAMVLAPTFSEYEIALRSFGCKVEHYYLNEENSFRLYDSFISALTPNLDMIFICNPNNPTGLYIEKNLMKKIAEKCKEYSIFLVIDECFVDFLEEEEKVSFIQYISDFSNVCILRAFTKMYAMAGIRLGYIICSDINFMEEVENTLQPWSVSTVASKCGVAALKDIDYVIKTKRNTAINRNMLIKFLNEHDFFTIESKTNFILFKCKTENFQEKLEDKGILIRSCKNFNGLHSQYYRIAVKSEEDNLYLMKCIKEILE